MCDRLFRREAADRRPAGPGGHPAGVAGAARRHGPRPPAPRQHGHLPVPTPGARGPAQRATLAAVVGNNRRVAVSRQVEELYLAVLSRKPRAEEAERLVKFVEGGDRKQRLRDVLWALLNSTEFVVNH